MPSVESFFPSSSGEEGQRVWAWRAHDATGAPMTTATSTTDAAFPTQAEAESWLGESWRELLDQGVESVTLLEGEREVYGPMSLRA